MNNYSAPSVREKNTALPSIKFKLAPEKKPALAGLALPARGLREEILPLCRFYYFSEPAGLII
jgi:hypothetical protein